MTNAELWVLPAWANPFLPALTEPTLGPWESPGRVCLAPALSDEDRHNWDEAVSGVRPWRPRTLREVLLCHIAEQQRELWPLPDDPLGPIAAHEMIAQQRRLRPLGPIVREILADADLRLEVRR